MEKKESLSLAGMELRVAKCTSDWMGVWASESLSVSDFKESARNRIRLCLLYC